MDLRNFNNLPRTLRVSGDLLTQSRAYGSYRGGKQAENSLDHSNIHNWCGNGSEMGVLTTFCHGFWGCFWLVFLTRIACFSKVISLWYRLLFVAVVQILVSKSNLSWSLDVFNTFLFVFLIRIFCFILYQIQFNWPIKNILFTVLLYRDFK